MPLPAGLKKRLKNFGAFRALNKFRHKVFRVLCNLVGKLPVSSLTFGPPKGRHFSTKKFVEQWKSDPENPAAFHLVHEGREVLVPAPKRITGTTKQLYLNGKTYRSEDAFIATIPWGRFYRQPQAIIGPDDRLLVDMSPWWGEKWEDHWIFDRIKLKKARTLRGKSLCLGSTAWFFHFLFDHLPILDMIERAGMRLPDFDHIILENHGQPFANVVLDHLGIPREKIVDPREHPHLLCESLTAASHPMDWGDWRPAYLRRAFADCCVKPPFSASRIYITRRNAPGRRVVNEHEILPLLERRGFEIIEVEKYTLPEQIAIFRQAEVIVAVGGAAFTLLSFSKPGTKVMSLFCDEDTTGGATMKMWDMICALNGIEFNMLCVPSPNLDVNIGAPCFVADMKPDVGAFEQMLDDVLA